MLALLAVLVAWVVALVIGRVPVPLHRFIAAWVRYSMHVMAFLFLVGGPFPGFVGAAGSYPVDLAIDPPVAAAETGDAVPRHPRDPRAAARRRVLGGAS